MLISLSATTLVRLQLRCIEENRNANVMMLKKLAFYSYVEEAMFQKLKECHYKQVHTVATAVIFHEMMSLYENELSQSI